MQANLDEVLERMRNTGPEFEGWLSNHGPMAADALLRMEAPVDVHAWLDRYCRRLEDAPVARWPIHPEDWREVLGDPSRLGDWLAYFDQALREAPWTAVLAEWWPRLIPGAVASATHGLIRTGHAVRALREAETAARLGELAQALGYWAARWVPIPGDAPPTGSLGVGNALDRIPALGAGGGIRTRITALGRRADWTPALQAVAGVGPDGVPAALDGLVDAAVCRYRRWASGNPVMLVHAATAPRAAALVLPSLPQDLWVGTYRAAWGTSAVITAAYRPEVEWAGPMPRATPRELAEIASANGDEHVIKFAEVALESAARGSRTAVASGLRAAELIR